MHATITGAAAACRSALQAFLASYTALPRRRIYVGP